MSRTVSAAETKAVETSHHARCIAQAEMNAWDNGCNSDEEAHTAAVANLIDGMATCYCEDYS